jgi:ABC-type nickel/cobalt efflux system permease component RcnA
MAAATGLVLGFHSGQDWALPTAGLQLVIGSAVTAIIVMTVITTWIPPALDRAGLIVRAIFGGGFILAGIIMLVKARSGAESMAGRPIGMPTEDSLRALVAAPELSLPIVVGACLMAMVWGAAHGLTPGHGKAIVGAYLVGARGTAWHAVYLGLTVTITHTLGVFLLGLVATVAATQVAPEKLYPWMGLVSGLIVLFLGVSMFVGRMRRLTGGGEDHHHHHHDHDHHHHHHDHDHHHHHHHQDQGQGSPDAHHGHGPLDHTHTHAGESSAAHSHSNEGASGASEHVHDPHFHYHGGVGHSHLPPGADGTPVTMRSLLALGISGGLLPCPSALVLLLAAIALHRVGFGLILVTAFSIGLAAVLTGVGLLFIKGSRLLDGVPAFSTASRWLPALSALAIGVLGIGITWGSIAQLTTG